MKKILYILMLLPSLVSGQGTKVKDLPTTTTGATGDFLIKDKAAGTVGSTQKISVGNLITTYSLTVNGGTVSTVTVTPNAGVTGVVTNPTTTPAIAITLGAITPTSVVTPTVTVVAGTFTTVTTSTLTASGGIGSGTTTPRSAVEVKDGKYYLSSTGIATGMTSLYPTDVIGSIEKSNASGGTIITGLNQSVLGNGLNLLGIMGGNTATRSAIRLIGGAKSGTGATVVNDTSMLFSLTNYNDTYVMSALGNGSMGIGTSSPNANSLLDLTSTTKAFLPPRMTTTQRDNIASPTNGMMIYNSTTGAYNGYQAGAWSAIGSASGVLGISNSSGVYTYYATYTLAMAAATAGQTIEQFADIVETGAVEITYKDGVNIDGHGHSYTLTNAGNFNAFSHNTAGGLNMSVVNLMVIRTTAGYQCFKIGGTSTGTFNFSGSLFTSTGAGNALQCFGAVKILNANCISNSGSCIYITDGTLYNSYGISTSAEGIYTEATLYDCIGQSGSGKGINVTAGTANGCTGISTSSYGVYVNGGDIIDCKGISTSSSGIWNDNTASNATNCTGVSVSGTGIYLLRSKSMTNLTAISSSGYAVRVGYSGTVNKLDAISTTSGAVFCDSDWHFYGGSFTSLYNNAAGYPITGNGGATGVAVNTIVGVTLKCANASAPYIYNNGVAIIIKMKDNNFIGGASTNANITSSLYGRATLVLGTLVVNTTAVTAISNIRLTAQTLGTITVPVGYAVSARTAATSFTILSGNLTDTSIISWEIEEPNN